MSDVEIDNTSEARRWATLGEARADPRFQAALAAIADLQASVPEIAAEVERNLPQHVRNAIMKAHAFRSEVVTFAEVLDQVVNHPGLRPSWKRQKLRGFLAGLTATRMLAVKRGEDDASYARNIALTQDALKKLSKKKSDPNSVDDGDGVDDGDPA